MVSHVTLRPMTRDDQYALYSFFINLGAEDRRFLRNVVTDRKLIEKWARNLNYDNVLPILAEHEGRIVANATLHYQTFGWGRHVAEIRVTVTPEFGPPAGCGAHRGTYRLGGQGQRQETFGPNCHQPAGCHHGL